MIIEEFQQEAAGQAYTTHQLPNVFRTRFMDERQLTEEMAGDPATVHGTSQNSTEDGGTVTPKLYGPNSPP